MRGGWATRPSSAAPSGPLTITAAGAPSHVLRWNALLYGHLSPLVFGFLDVVNAKRDIEVRNLPYLARLEFHVAL